jgi:hypothetical protein
MKGLAQQFPNDVPSESALQRQNPSPGKRRDGEIRKPFGRMIYVSCQCRPSYVLANIAASFTNPFRRDEFANARPI